MVLITVEVFLALVITSPGLTSEDRAWQAKNPVHEAAHWPVLVS